MHVRKFLSFFMTFLLTFTLMGVNVYGAKPGSEDGTKEILTISSIDVIQIELESNETSKSVSKEISSTYSKDLVWRATTDIGIVTIEGASSADVGNTVELILEVSQVGTGNIIVTATDATKKNIKTSISIPVEVTMRNVIVNAAPVAVADYATVEMGSQVAIAILENDYDVDDDEVSVSSIDGATGTTLDNGILYFSPSEPYYGSGDILKLEYQITDGKLLSEFATITIEITGPMVEPTEPIYVALGDSIPYGRYYASLIDYLFNGGTDTNSYVEQLKSYMNIKDDHFYDMSVSGYNTYEVLDQLDITFNANTVAQADIITLCVGANDIMDAVPRTFWGLDKYNINYDLASQGRDEFERDWVELILKIEGLNPDVELVVMTIYNPYHIEEVIYPLVDDYFTSDVEGDCGINYIMANMGTVYSTYENIEDLNGFDYKVADVYAAFKESDDYDIYTGFYNKFCDPHPNQLGHNLIFQVHKAVLEIQ